MYQPTNDLPTTIYIYIYIYSCCLKNKKTTPVATDIATILADFVLQQKTVTCHFNKKTNIDLEKIVWETMLPYNFVTENDPP